MNKEWLVVIEWFVVVVLTSILLIGTFTTIVYVYNLVT